MVVGRLCGLLFSFAEKIGQMVVGLPVFGDDVTTYFADLL